MSKTSIEVFAEKIEGSEKTEHGRTEAKFVIGEVSYSKGGVNYFSGNRSPRGYRIVVDVRTRGNGFESFMLFNGVSRGEFLEGAHAFSAKKLDTLAHDPSVLAKLQDLKAIVLANHRAKQPVAA